MANPFQQLRTPGIIPDDSSIDPSMLLAAAGQGAEKKNVYGDIINRAAQKYNVPYPLIKAIVKQESASKAFPNGNPNARSPVGAQGLMQLMPGTAKEMGVTDSNDPEQNVMGGTKYLGQMLEKFGGDKRQGVAAYNAGPGAVIKYGGVPPYKETQDYVSKVLGDDQSNPTANMASNPGNTPTPTDPSAPLLSSQNPSPIQIPPELLKSMGLDEKSLRRENLSHIIQQMGSGVAGVLSSFKTPEFAGQYSQEMSDREKGYNDQRSKQAQELSQLTKTENPELPGAVKEYQWYTKQEQASGRQPKSYYDWQIANKQAGAMAPISFEKLGNEKDKTAQELDLQKQRLQFDKDKEAKEFALKQDKGNKKKSDVTASQQAINKSMADMETLLAKIPAGRFNGGITQELAKLTGVTPHADQIAEYETKKNLIAMKLAKLSVGRVSQQEYLNMLNKVMPGVTHSEEERKSKFQGARQVIQDEINSALGDVEGGSTPTPQTPNTPQPSAILKQPGQPQQSTISPEDQQTIDWAKKNPNNPNAQAFLKKMGMQ